MWWWRKRRQSWRKSRALAGVDRNKRTNDDDRTDRTDWTNVKEEGRRRSSVGGLEYAYWRAVRGRRRRSRHTHTHTHRLVCIQRRERERQKDESEKLTNSRARPNETSDCECSREWSRAQLTWGATVDKVRLTMSVRAPSLLEGMNETGEGNDERERGIN